MAKLYDAVKAIVQAREHRQHLDHVRGFRVHPDCFTTAKFLGFHEFADWRTVPPELMQFAGMFCIACRKENIPMFVRDAYKPGSDGLTVTFAHAIFGQDLTSDQRHLLKRIGMEVSEKYGFAVVPLGAYSWTLEKEPEKRPKAIACVEMEAGKEVRLTPHQLKRQHVYVSQRSVE